jgi:hypothetical protein
VAAFLWASGRDAWRSRVTDIPVPVALNILHDGEGGLGVGGQEPHEWAVMAVGGRVPESLERVFADGTSNSNPARVNRTPRTASSVGRLCLSIG